MRISKLLRSKPFNSNEQLFKEAEDGNISAMNVAGLRCKLGAPANRRKAFSFYEKSAAAGDIGALYNLGDVYEQCERDLSLVYDYGIEEIILQKNADEAREALHKLAVDCYTEAAKKHFAPAIYRLANFAENERDFETALRLYQSTADLNYPPVQNALGYFKMNGIMTNTDTQSAFSLARYYERLHDLRGAVDYYRVAYEAGVQEAGESLRRCQDVLFSLFCISL